MHTFVLRCVPPRTFARCFDQTAPTQRRPPGVGPATGPFSEPFLPFEEKDQADGNSQHQTDCVWISEVPSQLRPIQPTSRAVKFHSVDSGNERQRDKNRR